MLGHDEFAFLVSMSCPTDEGEGGGSDGVDVLAEGFVSAVPKGKEKEKVSGGREERGKRRERRRRKTRLDSLVNPSE